MITYISRDWTYFLEFLFCILLSQAFFLDGPKKTQGEKNSKLKEKTQNSSLKPKKSALFEKFRMFLCEKLQVLWEKHEKICQNSRKNSKLKEKTQNSRQKLNFSAFLESCAVKKASKKKPALVVAMFLKCWLWAYQRWHSWVWWAQPRWGSSQSVPWLSRGNWFPESMLSQSPHLNLTF